MYVRHDLIRSLDSLQVALEYAGMIATLASENAEHGKADVLAYF